MNEPLHPLTLGEVLDRTAQVLERTAHLVWNGLCCAGVYQACVRDCIDAVLL